MLKVAYSFFIGILLAIFVGVGVAAFYEGPKQPDPRDYGVEYYEGTPSEDQLESQKAMDKAWRQYEDDTKPYSTNVSIITLVAAIALLAASLALVGKKYSFLSDGLMLGGVFTLLYSLSRSFAAQNSKYTFGVIAAGLFIAFILGYRRFIDSGPTTRVKKR